MLKNTDLESNNLHPEKESTLGIVSESVDTEKHTAKRTDVLGRRSVSRKEVLLGTNPKRMYKLFRSSGLNRRDSLYNALYLACQNKYDESDAEKKTKYMSVHDHPHAWTADKKKTHRHNAWSLSLKCLNGVSAVSRFFGACRRSVKGFFKKLSAMPKGMDNSVKAIKAFGKGLFAIALPLGAVLFGVFTYNRISEEMNTDYTLSVYVDGEYKGNTDNVYNVYIAKYDYDKGLSDKYGRRIELRCDLDFKVTPFDKKSYISHESGGFEEKLFGDYRKSISKRGFGLYIDGKLAAVTENESAIIETVEDYISNQRLLFLNANKGVGDELALEFSNYFTVSSDEYLEAYFITERDLRKLFDLPTLVDTHSDGSVGGMPELKFLKKENVHAAPQGTFTYSLSLDYSKLEGYDDTVSQPITVDIELARNEFERITMPYEVDLQYDNTMPEGMRRLVSAGKDGEKLVYYKASYRDNELVSRDVVAEEITKHPVNKVVRVGTKPLAEGEKNLIPTGTYIYPCEGGYLSSEYGWRSLRGQNDYHRGLDIAGQTDTPVLASDGGEVIEVGYSNGYGKYCIIQHNEDTLTRYAHCNEIYVEEGDLVGQGFPVGGMGATGNVTGVHVHFEIIVNGVTVDPMDYLIGDPPPKI